MPLTVDIRKTLRTAEREFRLDVSFTANSQRMVLFGPSGAGKSLTLQAIAGLLHPDEGQIVLRCSTARRASTRSRRLAGSRICFRTTRCFRI